MKVFFLVLFLATSYNSFSQEDLLINYNVNVKINKPSPDEKRSTYVRSALNAINDIQLVLYINKEASLFKALEQLDIDNSSKFFQRLARKTLSLNDNYYIDFIRDISFRETSVGGHSYKVQIDKDKYIWQIFKEKKIVCGYLCFKALTTRNYIDRNGNKVELEVLAWFSPDLNISSGPKDYSGLPGLILEIQEGDGLKISANKVELITKDESEFILPNYDDLIDEESFNKIVNKSYEFYMDKN